MNEIGIMGGAFSPPHFGHLLIAERACEQFELNKVLFIPSGNPPHKKKSESKGADNGLLSNEQRFELVQASIRGNVAFEASRIEIDRPGVTWSIDTLYALRAEHGEDVRLNFIIGDDNLAKLRDYDRRDEFLDLCRLLVSPRDANFTKKRRKKWAKRLGLKKLAVIDCPMLPISSTMVRERVAAGKSARYLAPDAVMEIIEREGYFRPKAEVAPKEPYWPVM
ncbi:MAG: nicotinate-nucleotide adenylyltransferase [Cyanobacteria bacterium]|nr:nicotinate-nucleotide adenylyltransferase [Cyanobacteriota bacterium]